MPPGGPFAPPVRLAAVDIGTNTCSMVIVGRRPRGRRYDVLEDYSVVTGLGRRRGPDGALAPDAVARTAAVLRLFRRRIVTMDVGRVLAAATAAVREAPDREFAEEASILLDARIAVLEAREEADTTFAAVAAAADYGTPVLMIDVGGGSTEIAVGRDGRVHRRVSMPLGAVRCTEELLGGRVPPRPGDLERIDDAVRRATDPIRVPSNCAVVAVAGTATTMVAVRDAVVPYDTERVHGATLTVGDLRTLEARMGPMDTDAIAALPGMQAGRAPFALAGCRILRATMEALGQPTLTVGDRGLRYGLLAREYPRIRIT